MRKFTALLVKEIKELLTKQLIISFAMLIIIFQILGKITEAETKKLLERQQIALMVKDDGTYSMIAHMALNSAFQVFPLEEKNIEDAVKKASESDIKTLVVIPEGFTKNLEKGQKSEIEIYNITKSLGLRERVQKALLTNLLNSVNEAISRNYIASKKLDADFDFVKSPVTLVERTYLRGKILNISSEAIFASIFQQSILLPIALFLLLMFTSQMVAAAMGQEKENKTLETLLTMPVSRFSIISAKMVSSVILAGVFAGGYMYGLRKYMFAGSEWAIKEVSQMADTVNLSLPPQALLLFGICVFLSLLVGLLMTTTISLFIENMRSAQLAVTPVMVLLMVPYFLSFTIDVSELAPTIRYLLYLIPFIHPFYFHKNYILGNTLDITIGIVYLVILTVLLTLLILKLFSTDLLITSKLGLRKKQLKAS